MQRLLRLTFAVPIFLIVGCCDRKPPVVSDPIPYIGTSNQTISEVPQKTGATNVHPHAEVTNGTVIIELLKIATAEKSETAKTYVEVKHQAEKTADVATAASIKSVAADNDAKAADDELDAAQKRVDALSGNDDAKTADKDAQNDVTKAIETKRAAAEKAVNAKNHADATARAAKAAAATKEEADKTAADAIAADAFPARLNAIDAIGLIASKSSDAAAVKALNELFVFVEKQPANFENSIERTLFALHVVQAAGITGYDARELLPALANVIKIDTSLVPAVVQAQHDIMNPHPAPKPTPQPPPADPNATALKQVQTQLAGVQTSVKALSDATSKLNEAMTNLVAAANQLSVTQPKPAPTQ